MYKNSIFMRLFLTFVLILTPIFLIGMNIYSWGVEIVKKEISSSMQNQVVSYTKNFENEILRTRMLQFDLFEDRALNKLALSSVINESYDDKMDLLRIQQRLSAIKSSSRYIKEVSVYIPSRNTSISTLSISEMGDEEQKLITDFPPMSQSHINYWKGKILLNGAYPIPGKVYKKPPLFLISIQLSETELKKMLKEFDVYAAGENLIYFDEYDLSIGGDGTDTQKTFFANFINRNKTRIMGEIKDKNTKDEQFSIEFNGIKYLLAYYSSPSTKVTIAKCVPEKTVFAKIARYRVWMIYFLFSALLILIIYSFSTYRFIHRPLRRLVQGLQQVEKGNMSIKIKEKQKSEFKYIFESFNSMVKNLNLLIDQLYRQKILTQKAELKQLQSQINPHFLYNSFFILHRRIKAGDVERASIFSSQLGEYFQFITRNSSDEVSLLKEVEHARIYANIQAARFSNRVAVDFQELPENLSNVMVPRLILQPIIENSFEHGLEDMTSAGALAVWFEETSEHVKINVEDNGSRMTESTLEKMKMSLKDEVEDIEITAIVNIHRRIRLKFGESSGVSLYKTQNEGLRVEICIEKEGMNKYV